MSGAKSTGRHGRLATQERRCAPKCRGYHLNLDAERIEHCDDCAALLKIRFDDLDAARLVLSLDDQFVCDVDDDGSPITLHSLARNTLACAVVLDELAKPEGHAGLVDVTENESPNYLGFGLRVNLNLLA